MSRNFVGIYSPVAATKLLPLQNFVMDAGINFYIEEYDVREKMGLPGGMQGNVVYEDRSGRRHVVLPTGFDRKSVGIHIDRELGKLSTDPDEKTKQELIQRADFEWVTEHVPGLMTSDWGLSYYVYDYHFRIDDSSDNLLKALLRSFEETDNWNRSITIFDFSKANPGLIEQYHQHGPFIDIFLQEDGSVKTIKGTGKRYGRQVPNVYIVHVGPQDHSVFVDFLRYSQIPAAITGDASLSEAVSLNKSFIYHPPGWKNHVFPHFIELAPDLIEDWRDSDRIRSLRGCDRVKEEDVESYPEVESFYIKHRKNIHRAKELEGECRDRDDYRTKASQLFGRLLQEQKINNAYKLEQVFQENDFAFSMAYYWREEGINAELHTLKKKHIFRTSIGIMGHEETSKLFYDEAYNSSFKRFNRALIEKMDISRNLARMIRKAAEKYGGYDASPQQNYKFEGFKGYKLINM
jgi:hypothetical protein